MQVNLSKQFLTPKKHHVNVVVDFFVEGNLVIDNSSILNNAFITNLTEVDFGMH